MKKWLMVLSLVFLAGFVAYQERDTLMRSYASWFVLDDATKGADALLILGGNLDTRAKKATELYKAGYAKALWATEVARISYNYPQVFKNPQDQLTQILGIEGIQQALLIPSLKGGALSTFDEAHDVAEYLKHNPIERLTVVTDGFHTRRAKMAFQKVFRLHNISTTLQFAPAYREAFDLGKWHKYESSLFTLLIREPLALLFYALNTSNATSYINEP